MTDTNHECQSPMVGGVCILCWQARAEKAEAECAHRMPIDMWTEALLLLNVMGTSDCACDRFGMEVRRDTFLRAAANKGFKV